MSASTGMGGAGEAAAITSTPPAPLNPVVAPRPDGTALEQQPDTQEAISDDTTAAAFAREDAGPDEDTPVFQEPGAAPAEGPANPST